MNFISQHKLSIIIVAVVLALGVWYGLSGTPTPSPTLITQSSSSGADQDLVSTLLALRAVKLEGTIFSDPAFVNLKDFSTQIIPEPVGRPNPFAPLSSGGSASASSTHALQLFVPSR